MARDPLPVLLRLRGIGLDAASRALADRLREEATAAARCAGIEAMIVRETAVQLSQAEEARTADSYAAWLGHAQTVRHAAREAVRTSLAATAEARAALNEARAATRTLEAALARVQDARRSATARLEQRAVDEAAAACGRPERWSG